jgi:hypothetical protein
MIFQEHHRMRKLFKPAAPAACALLLLLSACGGPQPSVVSQQNSNSSANSAQTSIQHGTSPSNLGVAASHGGGGSATTAEGGGSTAAGAALKPSVETPELDAKIQKAETKAKASGASEADKKAAAGAYFARADFYRAQGQPQLYKFALADYRRGLRYDPSNAEARQKMDEIVQIYQSMGRPVPDLGNEP